ncbi:hypothetical protein [Streptomyces sp. NPDC101150]|uniref:hypothetical protein n=1 Tax=Streptomyces sp. NPDC101150 TaxID=3366114 RepID=UPI0037F633CD
MSLPGADELFRTTGGTGLQSSPPRRPANGSPAGGSQAAGDAPRVPAPAGESDPAAEPDRAPTAVRHAEAPAADGGPVPGRTPGPAAPPPAAPAEHSGRAADAEAPKGHRPQSGQTSQDAAAAAAAVAQNGAGARRRGGGRGANRRPSGRERHDEKITVYVSAEELMDLEHARLVLRGEHGLAVDRGRIVREAVAVVLADLESRGDASILVRRLRGR